VGSCDTSASQRVRLSFVFVPKPLSSPININGATKSPYTMAQDPEALEEDIKQYGSGSLLLEVLNGK